MMDDEQMCMTADTLGDEETPEGSAPQGPAAGSADAGKENAAANSSTPAVATEGA